MGIYSWDLDGGFNVPLPKCEHGPHLTVRCEYPGTSLPSTEITFGLSGIHTACDAHDRFLDYTPYWRMKE